MKNKYIYTIIISLCFTHYFSLKSVKNDASDNGHVSIHSNTSVLQTPPSHLWATDVVQPAPQCYLEEVRNRRSNDIPEESYEPLDPDQGVVIFCNLLSHFQNNPEHYSQSEQGSSRRHSAKTEAELAQEMNEKETERKRVHLFKKKLDLRPIFPNKRLMQKTLKKMNPHFFQQQGINLLDKIYSNKNNPVYTYGDIVLALSKALHCYKKICGLKYFQENKEHFNGLKFFLEWFFSIHGPQQLNYSEALIQLPMRRQFFQGLKVMSADFYRRFHQTLNNIFCTDGLTVAQANRTLQQALTSYFLKNDMIPGTPDQVSILENAARAHLFQNHQDLLVVSEYEQG